MTPKEKAKELVDRFTPISKGDINQSIINEMPLNNEGKRPFKELAKFSRIYHTKQCALICVNYIITSNPHSNPFNTDVYSTMDYWKEVKQEIEKL